MLKEVGLGITKIYKYDPEFGVQHPGSQADHGLKGKQNSHGEEGFFLCYHRSSTTVLVLMKLGM